MEHTLVQHHTPIMPGLEHPSWPGRTIPAVLDGHEPPDWCVHCAWLAQEIRKADARGDWARMTDHARTGIGHVAAFHPEYGIDNLSDGRSARARHNLGGAS